MDNRRKWVEDLKREVDETLARIQVLRERPAVPLPPAIAAAQAFGDFKAARMELSRLELSVEELRRKLAERALKFQEEDAQKESLRARIGELSARAADAAEQAEALAGQGRAQEARIRELQDTAAAAQRAGEELGAALESARIEARTWKDEAVALQARLESAQPGLIQKERDLAEIARLHHETCRIFKEESELRLKEIERLCAEAKKARAHEAEMQSEADQRRRALDEERATLLAQVNKAMENVESIRRDAVESLEEARELKKGQQ